MEDVKPVATTTSCALCKKQVPKTEVFCNNCGYPQHGTFEQKEKYKKVRASKRTSLKKAKDSVAWGITILGIMAFLCFMLAIIMGANTNGTETTALVIMLGGNALIYGGLAIWSTFKPFPAILSGLIVYVTFLIINLFLEPSTAFSGLFFKGLIIAAFIKGIIASKKSTQLEKELVK